VVGAGKFRSFLPIEFTGSEINDSLYDKDKGHKSHLLNCPDLQKSWEDIKIKIDKQVNKQIKIK